MILRLVKFGTKCIVGGANHCLKKSHNDSCCNLSVFDPTEKTILDSVDDRRSLASASSEEEIKQTVLAKMQSLTNASEHICVELLESNKYDLHTSVEAYFAK